MSAAEILRSLCSAIDQRRWDDLLPMLDAAGGRCWMSFVSDDWAEDHHDVEIVDEQGGSWREDDYPRA